MTEAVAVEQAAPAVPAAPPPEIPAAPEVEVKPAEPAPASKGAESPNTEDHPEPRRSNGGVERKIKRLYREIGEHKAQRELAERRLAELERSAPRQPADPAEPKLEAFSDIEEYAKAKAEYATNRARREDEAKRASEQQRQFVEKLTSAWEDKVEKALDKYNDFDTVVGDLKPVNPLIVAIMDEDNGADVAYHLAKNPAEAQRIAQLHPIAQAREVGKLAAKLAAEPAKPKTPSQAPAPISPVGGKSGGANEMPQDSDDINTWMQKERAREKKLRSG